MYSNLINSNNQITIVTYYIKLFDYHFSTNFLFAKQAFYLKVIFTRISNFAFFLFHKKHEEEILCSRCQKQLQYYLFCQFLFGRKKKKNIFSNFSIFAFFCSNIFFFYIFWCMENYKSILLLSLPLFTSLTFVSFYPLTSAQVYGLYKNKENLHVVVLLR